ncbi:unnamed protein product, partial [Discosporangium mesarthrocarpum]
MARLNSGSTLPRKERRKEAKLTAKKRRKISHEWKKAHGDCESVNETARSSQSQGGVKPESSRNARDRTDKSGRAGKSTPKEAKRRKRWRPDEIDPMIAAEDAEMKRLERLLGVHGPNAAKKRSKLQRELGVEDGLGEDFGSFLDDLDRIGEEEEEGGEGEGEAQKIEEEEEEEEEEEGEGEEEAQKMEEEEEEERQVGNGNLGVGRGPEQEGDSAAEVGDDRDKEGEGILRHVYRPQEGQDIYGRMVGGRGDVKTPAKYVPPHLRATVGERDAGTTDSTIEHTAIPPPPIPWPSATPQRTVNGILNRLSEDTLEPVLGRLHDVYRSHSNTEVNRALWQSTQAVCVHERQVMMSLIPSFAAVIAALHITLGADVGGHFLEAIAHCLKQELVKAKPAATVGGTWAGFRSRGAGSNLILLLGYLYNLGVAHCTLVYDLVRLLVEDFGDLEMELLLLLLCHCGFQLRTDDPQALKEIVVLVKAKASTHSQDGPVTNTHPPDDTAAATRTKSGLQETWLIRTEGGRKGIVHVGAGAGAGARGGGGGQEDDVAQDSSSTVAGGGSRAGYVLETILELQSNKRSRLQLQGRETEQQLRKWLGGVKAKMGGVVGGDSTLRVSWRELTSSQSAGRWWKVGAAWAGKDGGVATGVGAVEGKRALGGG